MPREMSARDQEIVRLHAVGQKAGRIAADLDIPVARVWRALATFWRAEARRWEAEAVRHHNTLVEEREAHAAVARSGFTLEQRAFLRALAREESLARRMKMADTGRVLEETPRVLDLRSAAARDVTPREEHPA